MTSRAITHGDLFAGIGGFSAGFAAHGIQTLWYVEQDRDCQRVLGRHYPDALILGDVRECGRHNLPEVDVISFGFPCQDLSVAGKRAGLNGERSSLFYDAIRICRELRPALAVLENVPGLLSSHGGRDFASVLHAFRECGARDIGWATLDAQYFGVAQCRRRVFVVADFRGWGRAGQILFVTESGARDLAASREAGPELAGTLGTGSPGRGWSDDLDRSGAFIVSDYRNGLCEASERAGPLTGSPDRSRAAPIIYQATGAGYFREGDATICRDDDNGTNQLVIQETFIINAAESCAKESHARQSDVACCLDSTGSFATNQGGTVVLYNPHRTLQKDGSTVEGFKPDTITDALHGPTGNKEPLIFQPRLARNGRGGPSDVAYALSSSESGGRRDCKPHVFSPTIGVRRLMPIECERLQGFPDGWSAVDAEGKAISDSARYRMLGNAVNVTVAEWLGRRIRAVFWIR
jgi:DNA (cytosine-5)-methyltransferase 1